MDSRNEWLWLVLSLLLFFISKDHPLFWDTIQFAGRHPQHYYEHGFSYFFLPIDIDSGHFPVFGMYIAAMWKVLGRSLLVTHLSMLPFTFLCFHFAFALGKQWTGSEKLAWLFPLWLVALPGSITQMMLVSPDIILLCSFLGLLYALTRKKNWIKILCSILLAVISQRGLVVLILVVVSQLVIKVKQGKFDLLKAVLPFVPALLIGLLYQWIHYVHSGWTVTHDTMPWSSSFALADISDIAINIGVYIWRLLDFGALFMWIGMICVIFHERSNWYNDRFIPLLVLLIGGFGLMTIPFAGLMQHRYFLPALVLGGFLVIKYLAKMRIFTSKALLALMFVGALTGNFWIYPDRIAQGWDSTLAHLPYYSLFDKMNEEVKERNLKNQDIGTTFPMRTPFDILYLNGEARHYSEKDLNVQDYILYSNISNDFNDEEIDELQQNWQQEVRYDRMGVKMILYKRRTE